MEKPRNMMDFNKEQTNKFLNSFDTIVTDCDGVLWLGETAIEGSLETLKRLQALGKRVLFVSNNSTISLEQYVEKFKKFDYTMTVDEIAIPSKVICWYLKSRGFNGKAFVIGSKTFRKVLEEAGIDLVEARTNYLDESFEAVAEEYKKCPEAKAVIVDLDINVNWASLGRAIRYLRNSQVLYLTGALDRQLPVARHMTLLGTGIFAQIISEESKRNPVCCGKPSEAMKNYVIGKFGLVDPSRCIFVGDSLENDMKFADLCGFKTLWVGSGVDTPESTSPTIADSPVADYYLPSLSLLLPLLDSCTDNNSHSTQKLV